MAEAADQSVEQDFENLNARQRLRAAFHYTTMKICQETEQKYGLRINHQVIATIAETLWKQAETFALDLEQFAKHARRTVISPDDVMLLVRRNPSLLAHMEQMHEDQLNSRDNSSRVKKGQKRKSPPMGAMNRKLSEACLQEAAVDDMDVDEESDK